MIAKELVNWCENHGKKCEDCQSYTHCEYYTETTKNATFLNIHEKKEVDDKWKNQSGF